jgi:mono/diheme cytochrome c family protein
MRFVRLAIVLGISTLSAAVITGSARSQTVREHDAEWTAPVRQAARTNPIAGRADVVRGGDKLFHERCSTCHGEDARGTDRGPNLTTPTVQAQSDGALFWKISSGNTRTGMPTFSFLPELQRWQLVMHVRAHARRAPSTP